MKTLVLKYTLILWDTRGDIGNIFFFGDDEEKFREECRIDFDILFTSIYVRALNDYMTA